LDDDGRSRFLKRILIGGEKVDEAHGIFSADEESALAVYIQSDIIGAGDTFLSKHRPRVEFATILEFQASTASLRDSKLATPSPREGDVSSGGRNQMTPQGSRDGRTTVRESLHQHHGSVF
jgi:hypothetical protein